VVGVAANPDDAAVFDRYQQPAAVGAVERAGNAVGHKWHCTGGAPVTMGASRGGSQLITQAGRSLFLLIVRTARSATPQPF